MNNFLVILNDFIKKSILVYIFLNINLFKEEKFIYNSPQTKDIRFKIRVFFFQYFRCRVCN